MSLSRDAVLSKAHRCAASARAHAVEYYRREQLAMLAWRNGGVHAIDAAALLQCLMAVAAPFNQDQLPAYALLLARFPWFAFAERFLRSRVGERVEKQRADALCSDLPWSVHGGRSLRLGVVLERLVARLTPPALPVMSLKETRDAIESHMDSLVAAMRDDCARLLEVADEFVGLVARAYDAVSGELRWLTLPAVLERKLRFDDHNTCDWLVLCTTPLPSFTASVALVCAPQHVSGEAIEDGLYFHRWDVRARFVVQLFECVEHYVAVGGCAFVCRATAAALLPERAVARDAGPLLPLIADLLRTAIVVALADGGPPLFVPPTASTYGKRQTDTLVFFEKAAGVWHVGRLRGRLPVFEGRA